MENVRNRIDVRLNTNAKAYKKLVSTPSFVSQKIFNKDLVAIRKIKKILTFNKFAYVGMYKLDFGKTLTYDFHQNCIKDRHGKKGRLVFADTDNFVYEI